jgi:tetratricopeptide (TPR) repeat protein
VPIADVAFEHRMYLPLAAVVAGAVGCAYELLKRAVLRPGRLKGLPAPIVAMPGLVLAVTVVLVLGLLTFSRNGDYRSVLAVWQDTISKRPANYRAYNNRGLAYSDLSDLPRAISDFNESIRLNRNYAVAYCNRGMAYGNQGDFDRAIDDFTKAVELSPTSPKPYFNRGLAYVCKGDYDQAIRDYDKAIEFGPRYAAAHEARAVALTAKRDAAERR